LNSSSRTQKTSGATHAFRIKGVAAAAATKEQILSVGQEVEKIASTLEKRLGALETWRIGTDKGLETVAAESDKRFSSLEKRMSSLEKNSK
jgi:hypothetical protein